MKIAILINSLSLGGAEKFALQLANSWQESGHAVSILTFSKSPSSAGDFSGKIKIFNLSTAEKPTTTLGKILKFISLIPKIRSKILALAPDVVVSFMDQANVLAALALRCANLPLVVAERSNPSRTSLFDLVSSKIGKSIIATVRNWAYRRADLIVVQTERSKAHFPLNLQSRLVVIPNYVKPPSSTFSKKPITEPHIISIGRLTYAKRFDLLIDAFAIVRTQIPNSTLTIYGEGGCRAALNKQVTNLSLNNCVSLPGEINQTEEALSQASLFVLSSEFEGFPNALCEAAAHGIPCIAFDCEYGPREILGDNERGLLVTAGNISELARAIKQVLEDSKLQLRLSAAGAKLPELFSEKSVLESWHRSIASILRKD